MMRPRIRPLQLRNMPWGAKDAQAKDSKANTPKKRRMWRDIANKTLASTGDEARAVRTANGVLKRMGKR